MSSASGYRPYLQSAENQSTENQKNDLMQLFLKTELEVFGNIPALNTLH